MYCDTSFFLLLRENHFLKNSLIFNKYEMVLKLFFFEKFLCFLYDVFCKKHVFLRGLGGIFPLSASQFLQMFRKEKSVKILPVDVHRQCLLFCPVS